MLSGLVLSITVAMLQPFWGPHGENPEAETFVVTLKDGSVFYGFIVSEDAKTFTVELDEPWKPRDVKHFSRSRVDSLLPEYSGARRKRIEDGWKAIGYVMVETPQGMQVAVDEGEAEAARLAREWAGVKSEGEDTELPPPGPEPEQSLTPEQPTGDPGTHRGLVAQWVPHAALALVAALGIGIVVKRLLLSD